MGEPTPSAAVAHRAAIVAGSGAGRRVVLADLSRHALLRGDAPSTGPGLAELLQIARFRRPDGADVRALVRRGEEGHDVLAGGDHPLDWVATRAEAAALALRALRRAAHLVVALVDPDLDGELETGSVDVEDRHALARAAVAASSAIAIATAPGPVGQRLAEAWEAGARPLRPEATIRAIAVDAGTLPRHGLAARTIGELVDAACRTPMPSGAHLAPGRLQPGDLGLGLGPGPVAQPA
ncbi:MAG TPA: hypothetical protein P5254_03715 [Aquihabitans sp.]|nr:hypothetical protein [Aquihabitans sp.]